MIWLAALGTTMLGIQQLALWGIVRLTLRMMRDVKAEAFARVQRFSASWHAESFSRAVVRQVLRGAGAVESLNDVIAFAVLPNATVLVGASVRTSGARAHRRRVTAAPADRKRPGERNGYGEFDMRSRRRRPGRVLATERLSIGAGAELRRGRATIARGGAKRPRRSSTCHG